MQPLCAGADLWISWSGLLFTGTGTQNSSSGFIKSLFVLSSDALLVLEFVG